MPNKKSKITLAKEMVKKVHGGKTRLSGESYFLHATNVCNRLKSIGADQEEILVTALLHEILVNHPEYETEVKETFGVDIFNLLKKYKQLSRHDIITPTEENYPKLIQTYLNIADDLRLLLVRIADRTESIKTAYVFPPEKREIIANKALYLYSPISRLLGVPFTRDLENYAFKLLYPRQYYKIQSVISKKTPDINRFLTEAIPQIYKILKQEGMNPKIDSRIKHCYAVHKKTLRYIEMGKKVSNSYSHIDDLGAIRIIVDTVDECYKTEKALLKIWPSMLAAKNDYIKYPKPSGYQSIHLILKVKKNLNVEIQIRTHEMHENNEYGYASHFFYKTADSFREVIERDPDILKSVNFYELQKQQDVELEKLKMDYFKDKVYAFTPGGDVMELPSGATLLDFAYYIHTDLGNRFLYGFVNGKNQEEGYKIKNGDHVTIQTADFITVEDKNKKNVNTKRAKQKINSVLRKIEDRGALVFAK